MSNHKDKIYQINPFSKIIFSLTSIFSLYAGYLDTSIPAFLLITLILLIHFFQIKITFIQLIVIFIFVIYSIIILTNSVSIISTLSNLKWFYGILFFLIISKVKNIRLYFFNYLSSHKVFLLFIALIIFETILINLILTPEQVYGAEFKSSTISSYNRPLGGVGNSSVTSTFIIAWYYSINFKEIKYQNYIFLIYSVSVLLLMSGTGFILYFMTIIISQWLHVKRLFKSGVFAFISTILISLIFYFIFLQSYHQKLSLNYYSNVLKDKFSFLTNGTISNEDKFLPYSDFTSIFGYTLSSDVPLNGSDFGWINLIYTHGILGFIIFILIILAFSYNAKKNKLSILILFLGLFHYSAIFLAAGQMLLTKLIMKDK